MRRLVATCVAALTVSATLAVPTTRADGTTSTVDQTTSTEATTTTTLPPSVPPLNSGSGRRAVYSISRQRVWVYSKNNTVVRTFAVSGRLGVPNLGTYKVRSKSAWACSADHRKVCMRYMIRFAKGPAGGNVGFHEIPRDTSKKNRPWLQTVDQLGQPLSDGCVRESTADAKFMWNYLKVGSIVVVVP